MVTQDKVRIFTVLNKGYIMVKNSFLIKALKDKNKYESFLEKISTYNFKKHTNLFSFLNSLEGKDIKEFVNLIDKVTNFKDLSYPTTPLEKSLYSIFKQGIGKGEIYSVFSVKNSLNSPTNLYDITLGDQKVEVKQINLPTDPSDPAKKGRLTSFESFNEILPILNDLKKLISNKEFLNHLHTNPELKKNTEEVTTEDFLNKVRSGEITAKSYYMKRKSGNKFALILNVIKGLHKSNLPDFKENYNLYRLFNHPYIKNPNSLLKQIIKDRDSVWKYDSKGEEKNLYVLLFEDSTQKIYFDKASVIFPGSTTNKKGGDNVRNITNISRGGLRFFKNPNLK